MKDIKVGIQLYSLRDELAKDMDGTLKRVKDMGYDYVEFAGRLSNGDEVREKIRNSDIFILPTYAEGLHRVILEAMSLGLPCL